MYFSGPWLVFTPHSPTSDTETKPQN